MHRTRLLLPLAGVLALAACSNDTQVSLLAPSTGARTSSVTASASGDYIVVGGFGTDFDARVAALGGTIKSKHQDAGVAVVSNISDPSALTTIIGVTDVQPDVEITLDTPVASVDAADVDASDAAAVIGNPDDPTRASRYNFQWNMRLIGANVAWAAGQRGDRSVTAAILDTGIDYDAPDLLGLVDLSRSASFVASDDAITAHLFPTRNKISDYNGHGTNVATQVSSNARALAGVTSKTTLIGVKVLSGQGSGAFSGILNGILFAADQGADVANMSLGGGFARSGNMQFINVINQTINYAKRKGMVIVVAAGNDGSDLDNNGGWFASFCDAKHVICVSAVGPRTVTDNPNTPAYFTNYGRKSIDVAGPGGNADAAHGFTASPWPWGRDIASWVWSYCSKTRLVFTNTGAVAGLAGCQLGNRLTGYIGTSQATPHVAGLAALLVAQNGKAHPEAIKQLIEKGADDFGLTHDAFISHGRINVPHTLGIN